MGGEIDELVRLLQLEEREPGRFESRAIDTDLAGGSTAARSSPRH